MKHKRDLEFPSHTVTIVEQRSETVGQSVFYVAEENQRKKRVGSATERNFLIKATIATTYEEAKRAVAEAQALRHLPVHHNILKMIDSGCATFGPVIGEHDVNGAELIDKHGTYCLLFKGSLR